MRKFLISIAAAASALVVAAPASAQWAPPTYRYQSFNYGSGDNGFNFARSMEARVQRVRGDIREMQARRILSWNEARGLENEAASIQRRIYKASRNGIQPGEARNVENRIQRLENHVSREASDWNGRSGRYGYYN